MCTVSVSSPDTSYYENWGPNSISRLCFNRNGTKCLWRWEPDRRSNFFFSPPAHLCAVTYMTEISLIVTLNKQFNSTQQPIYRVPSDLVAIKSLSSPCFVQLFSYCGKKVMSNYQSSYNFVVLFQCFAYIFQAQLEAIYHTVYCHKTFLPLLKAKVIRYIPLEMATMFLF